MIELPETYVLADQINNTLVGKKIMNVVANQSPHKFAWFHGDPEKYHEMLTGKTITGSNPGTGYTCGGNTEILIEDMLLVISTPIKYHGEDDKIPEKHQLLIEFEDFSFMSCTVQMWGAMLCYSKDNINLPDGFKVNKAPTPLTDAFNEAYFKKLMNGQTMSVKGFLATEQRIPGLGNGVLQDILFNARLHPKRKMTNLNESEKQTLFQSVKSTLFSMTTNGGRDTEKDLFNCKGGYRTILSSKTIKNPCPVCGDTIIRTAYLGGNIYYCPTCQPA